MKAGCDAGIENGVVTRNFDAPPPHI